MTFNVKQRSSQKRSFFPAASVVSFLVAGVLGFAMPAQAQDVITFGASLSLTGGTATEGRLVKEGYDFYVKHINEKGGIKVGDKTYKVAIKYYDDASTAATSVQLYEKLINEDGIKLLLGPYSSGVTFAASAVAEKYQLPMVAAHAASPAIYDRGFKYIFATLTPLAEYTGNSIKMAAAANPKAQRVALISENALFPKSSGEAAALQAKAAGLEVVYNEIYPTGTKDFSAMLAAMKSKNPDLLLFAGYTGDATVIARQIAEVGVNLKMFGVSLGPTLPGFIEALGPKAEGILEPIQWAANAPWKDEIFGWTAPQFAEMFQKEVGHFPDYHPPQSVAALEVYQRALEKAGSLDPRKVRDAIAETNIMTMYGPIRFNEKGQNIAKGMSVVQVQNGKAMVVYPADGAQAKFIYPLPPR
ncbi:MAG: amino acid ABC transporter substrate-binding protein [Betaproteobacteria bacterium]